MYLNWKAQLELELQNHVKAHNRKLIDESRKTLAQLEENYKDVDLGIYFNKDSFITTTARLTIFQQDSLLILKLTESAESSIKVFLSFIMKCSSTLQKAKMKNG